jgi:hypothetical protein
MKHTDEVTTLEALFGPVISSYSRIQAIEDGVLVDAGPMASEAGFSWPVALTVAAWQDCVAWSDEDNLKQVYQDQSGRLWDVLFMGRFAIQCNRKSGDRIEFQLNRVPRDGKSRNAKSVTLKLIVGPGDDGEPVITILQPHED